MPFQFQYIEYLLGLALVPVMIGLYLLVLNWKKRVIKKIGDKALVQEMIKNYSPQRFALKFTLITVAFALGVAALANPRAQTGTEKVTRNGIDVMIALDVSKSMLAQDIKPTRLDRAKQVLGKLIDKLGGDRVGIVVFAGKAYLQMPLTGDQGAAKMFLSAATTDVVPTQGTVIGDALKMCLSCFNAKERKYKSVVLVSDGEDHDESAGSIATQMASEGVVINTIGIGSPDGAPIIDPVTNEAKKDNEGNTVLSKLNEEELKSIAQKGNGIYQLFTNTDAVVGNIESQLSSMDKRAVTDESLINYKSFFQYVLIAVLLLLLVEFFIAERIKVNFKKKLAPAKAAVFPLLLCLLPFVAAAQSEKQAIKKGNEAYNNKEFEKAAAEYQKVPEKTPENTIAQYNLGNAFYKNNKADDAVKAYDNALSSASTPAEKAKAFYNKGVVLQNNKKLPECIEAYKNALKIDPTDEDARQNLQRALMQQKQQQQQQKQDKKDQQKKQDPKQDKDKKDQQKPKDEQNKDEPKPQPSKISKQDAEEKLKALMQQEKNLQDKLRKVNTASPNKPEKDW